MADLSNETAVATECPLAVNPEISEARIAPGEETTQMFELWNKGDSILNVTVGANGLPDGTSIFLHQERLSVDAGEKMKVGVSLEMDADLTLKRTFEFTPHIRVSGANAKCIIKTTTKVRKDDAIYAGQEGSIYISIFVKNVAGEETPFALKKTTPLGRLMDVYSEKVGIPLDKLRFTYNDKQLVKYKEFQDYGIKHLDKIDVVQLQPDS